MSKTKQVYISEGVKMFKDGKERPVGNSWQAEAKQEGWDCSFSDLQDEKLDAKQNVYADCDLEDCRDVAQENIFGNVWDALADNEEERDTLKKEILRRREMKPFRRSSKLAIQSHVDFLFDKANNTEDAVKSSRYYIKALKLQTKWHYRGVNI